MEKDQESRNNLSVGNGLSALPAAALGVGSFLVGKTTGKTKILYQNGTENGVSIPPEAFDNPFKIDWNGTAFDRSAEEYFYHTALRPICAFYSILKHQNNLNKAQKDRLRARIINILSNGGSWFGADQLFVQRISINGGYRTFDTAQANNKVLGRNGGRKTHSGDVSAWNSFFAYMSFVDLDSYFRAFQLGSAAVKSNARTFLKDQNLVDFASLLFEVDYVVYENSVSQQLAWVRDKNEVTNIVDNLLLKFN